MKKITEYIKSNAVREYIEKNGIILNIVQAGYIISSNKNIKLAERAECYKMICDTYDDMSVHYRNINAPVKRIKSVKQNLLLGLNFLKENNISIFNEKYLDTFFTRTVKSIPVPFKKGDILVPCDKSLIFKYCVVNPLDISKPFTAYVCGGNKIYYSNIAAPDYLNLDYANEEELEGTDKFLIVVKRHLMKEENEGKKFDFDKIMKLYGLVKNRYGYYTIK